MVDDGILFLTNYSSKINTRKNVNQTVKKNDYGIYVKMITDTDYNTNLTLIDTSIDTNSVLILESLKNPNSTDGIYEGVASSGFNSFGGIFGIQDFGKINFGAEGSENLPAKYVFYKDEDIVRSA